MDKPSCVGRRNVMLLMYGVREDIKEKAGGKRGVSFLLAIKSDSVGIFAVL